MINKYSRLNDSDREEISRGLSAKWTFSHIAHNINRPVSTVSREVHKNCKKKRCYRANKATLRTTTIRHRSKQTKKIDANVELWEYIVKHLKDDKWSPEEIAKRLKKEYPDNMSMHISYESIYSYLYCLPRGSLKKELLKSLRQERKFRHNRKAVHAKRSTISDFISIQERPEEVRDRIIPGHWEGDLIMGKAHASALGTLVERTTRYLLLVPLVAKDASSVRIEFGKAVKNIPKNLRKSLTYDRGTEMAQHRLFTKETNMQVYFADPHSPWQRGTNENTNGLIRQYFPKGTDFKTVTKQEIKRVQDQLNDRPRKALEFYKPDEAFSKLLTLENLR